MIILWDVVVVLEIFVLMRGDKFFEVKYVVLIVMEMLGVKDRVCIFYSMVYYFRLMGYN